jgi:hypothetical protein
MAAREQSRSIYRSETARLQRRVHSMLEVELRRGSPERDQLEALARDMEIEVQLLVLCELVIERAETVVRNLTQHKQPQQRRAT